MRRGVSFTTHWMSGRVEKSTGHFLKCCLSLDRSAAASSPQWGQGRCVGVGVGGGGENFGSVHWRCIVERGVNWVCWNLSRSLSSHISQSWLFFLSLSEGAFNHKRVCMCVHIHLHTHIYIYIYTHTHAKLPLPPTGYQINNIK